MAVRLYVDKPGGVTISDCQQLSHEVGDLIGVSTWSESSYDLEVVPRLDRELRRDQASVGHRAFRGSGPEPVDGDREHSGQLVQVTPEAWPSNPMAIEAFAEPLVTKAPGGGAARLPLIRRSQ